MKKVYKHIFQWLLSLWKAVRLQNSSLSLYHIQIECYLYTRGDPLWEDLSNYIVRWRLAGYQVTRSLLTTEIPNEYIGIVTILYGEKLIRHQYLTRQEVNDATMIINSAAQILQFY